MMEKKLPEGWEKVNIGKIYYFPGGGTPSKAISSYWNGDIPWASIKDISRVEVLESTQDFISESGLRNSASNLAQIDEVIIGTRMSPGKPVLTKIVTAINQDLKIVRSHLPIPARYTYYLFRNLEKEFESKSAGTTVKGIRLDVLNDILMPLPPLSEQKRIVAKLDKTFGHLDTLKASLARIPALLKTFRQSVLTQAVTGKSTERSENESYDPVPPITIGNSINVAPKGWKWDKLVNLAKLESGHTPRKSVSSYWENGDVPWISLQDIRHAHGKFIHETKFMPTNVGIKNSSARLLPAGTVCFCRDISVGFTTIMGKEMSTTQHFANWICGQHLNNKYLLYAFMASRKSLISSGTGTTVSTIYMPALKELRILIPPIEEQHKIVERIETLLATAEAIEAQYISLKQKIDKLPQALLAKAFRGELVAQDPNDEPAAVLLEKIQKEMENLGKKGKKQMELVFEE